MQMKKQGCLYTWLMVKIFAFITLSALAEQQYIVFKSPRLCEDTSHPVVSGFTGETFGTFLVFSVLKYTISQTTSLWQYAGSMMKAGCGPEMTDNREKLPQLPVSKSLCWTGVGGRK